MSDTQPDKLMRKGDVIWMGYRRRSFWEWLINKPSKPQFWQIKNTAEVGGVAQMEKINE